MDRRHHAGRCVVVVCHHQRVLVVQLIMRRRGVHHSTQRRRHVLGEGGEGELPAVVLALELVHLVRRQGAPRECHAVEGRVGWLQGERAAKDGHRDVEEPQRVFLHVHIARNHARQQRAPPLRHAERHGTAVGARDGRHHRRIVHRRHPHQDGARLEARRGHAAAADVAHSGGQRVPSVPVACSGVHERCQRRVHVVVDASQHQVGRARAGHRQLSRVHVQRDTQQAVARGQRHLHHRAVGESSGHGEGWHRLCGVLLEFEAGATGATVVHR